MEWALGKWASEGGLNERGVCVLEVVCENRKKGHLEDFRRHVGEFKLMRL